MSFKTKIPFSWDGRFKSAFGFGVENILGRLPISLYGLEKLPEVPEDYGRITMEYESIKLEFNALPFLKEPKVPIPIKIPFLKDKDNSVNTIKILAPTPYISFIRKKKLITTPLSGNNGEIIENWGNDNYEIRMQGLIVDIENHIYPSYRIELLHKLFEYNGLVNITGVFFDEKDIKFIYFKSIDINPVEGFDDTVKFTLIAKSSKEVNLKID